jgi:hypothetical protein
LVSPLVGESVGSTRRCQGREILSVASLERRRLDGVAESFEGIVANGVEHAVTNGRPGLHGEQRRVHQTPHQVEYRVAVEHLVTADRFGCREREPTVENRQAPQEGPLLDAEEIVTPLHGCPQGLLTLRAGLGPVDEQCESVVEAIQDLARRERGDAGRGKLQRQGDPVEPATDPNHLVDVARVQLERSAGLCGSFDEQDHCVHVTCCRQ